MDNDIAQERKITNNEIWHKLDMLIQQQNACNKDLLQGLADLRVITEKHGKTLYGNGTAGLCENTRTLTDKVTAVTGEITTAKVRIWGLIFAAAAFVLIELIKLI